MYLNQFYNRRNFQARCLNLLKAKYASKLVVINLDRFTIVVLRRIPSSEQGFVDIYFFNTLRMETK